MRFYYYIRFLLLPKTRNKKTPKQFRAPLYPEWKHLHLLCFSPHLYILFLSFVSLSHVFFILPLHFPPHLHLWCLSRPNSASPTRRWERILPEQKHVLVLSSLKASALPTVWCVLMLGILPLPLCSVSPAADTLISLQSFLLSLHRRVLPVLFVLSPFTHCLSFCCTLAAHFIVFSLLPWCFSMIFFLLYFK